VVAPVPVIPTGTPVAAPTSGSGSSSSSSSLSGGAVAGIVIGVLVGVGILAGVAWFLYNQSNSGEADGEEVFTPVGGNIGRNQL